MKFTLFLTLIINVFLGFSAEQNQEKTIDEVCSELNFIWMEKCIDLTKNGVGYSAPVAARTFNYISIGVFEAMVEKNTNQKSLSVQLTDVNRKTGHNNKEELHYPSILNETYYRLICHYFKNMPPSKQLEVNEIYWNNVRKINRRKLKRSIQDSKAYAEILMEVLKRLTEIFQRIL